MENKVIKKLHATVVSDKSEGFPAQGSVAITQQFLDRIEKLREMFAEVDDLGLVHINIDGKFEVVWSGSDWVGCNQLVTDGFEFWFQACVISSERTFETQKFVIADFMAFL